MRKGSLHHGSKDNMANLSRFCPQLRAFQEGGCAILYACNLYGLDPQLSCEEGSFVVSMSILVPRT